MTLYFRILKITYVFISFINDLILTFCDFTLFCTIYWAVNVTHTTPNVSQCRVGGSALRGGHLVFITTRGRSVVTHVTRLITRSR